MKVTRVRVMLYSLAHREERGEKEELFIKTKNVTQRGTEEGRERESLCLSNISVKYRIFSFSLACVKEARGEKLLFR